MTYTIYQLPDHEFNRYKTHLLSLDTESRYMRFGFQVKDETIEDLCNRWQQNVDKNKIFVIENEDLEIVAVSHINLEESIPEFAFSVLKEYQHQGMGDALMKRAIEYCQNKGIKHGSMICLATNSKIKQLARKNNILVTSESSDSFGEIEIPDPTPISYWHEYVEDSLGRISHIGKAQRKFAQMFRFPLSF